MIFECVGRYFYLGNEVEKVHKSIKQVTSSPFVGFYTLGEQGSSKNRPSCNNTYTVTMMCIGDKLIAER